MKYLSILALVLTLLSCGDEVVTFKTVKERYSYLLGVEIAKPFVAQAPFNQLDKEQMIAGFADPVKETEVGILTPLEVPLKPLEEPLREPPLELPKLETPEDTPKLKDLLLKPPLETLELKAP
jgi:hypothetical protein